MPSEGERHFFHIFMSSTNHVCVFLTWQQGEMGEERVDSTPQRDVSHRQGGLEHSNATAVKNKNNWVKKVPIHFIFFHYSQYSGPLLIMTPLLPKNSVLTREVSFGERENYIHS